MERRKTKIESKNLYCEYYLLFRRGVRKVVPIYWGKLSVVDVEESIK